jgi:hypothetical protein
MLDHTHRVSELAATRLRILSGYDGSDDHLTKLIEIEAAIVAAPVITDSDWITKNKILYETKVLDFADLFKIRLFESLRHVRVNFNSPDLSSKPFFA